MADWRPAVAHLMVVGNSVLAQPAIFAFISLISCNLQRQLWAKSEHFQIESVLKFEYE
jgi:hypothetical protein